MSAKRRKRRRISLHESSSCLRNRDHAPYRIVRAARRLRGKMRSTCTVRVVPAVRLAHTAHACSA